jgi:hypothetical protein
MVYEHGPEDPRWSVTDWLAEPSAWAAAAAGSGIVGSIAYDSLKNAASRLRPGISRADKTREALMKLAVIDQCHQAGMLVPNFDDLVIDPDFAGSESAIVTSTQDPSFEAYVLIGRNPQRDGVRVAIRKANGGSTAAQGGLV